MDLDPALIISIITAALGGGGISELLHHRRERHKADGDLHRTGFEVLAGAWHQEHARLIGKVDHLEDIVVALSDEIVELGGDPLRIRACLRTKPTTPKGGD